MGDLSPRIEHRGPFHCRDQAASGMITGAFQNNVRQLLGRLSVPIAALALLLSSQPSQGQSLKKEHDLLRERERTTHQIHQNNLERKYIEVKEAQYGQLYLSGHNRLPPNHQGKLYLNRVHLYKVENGVVYKYAFKVDIQAGWRKTGLIGQVVEHPPATVLLGEDYQPEYYGANVHDEYGYSVEWAEESGKICDYTWVSLYSSDSVNPCLAPQVPEPLLCRYKKVPQSPEVNKICIGRLTPKALQVVAESVLADNQ